MKKPEFDSYSQFKFELKKLGSVRLPPRFRKYFIRCIGPECDWVCQNCFLQGTDKVGPDGRPWHVDHDLAISKGGTCDEDNLFLSCGSCNSRKGTMTHEDWVISGRRGSVLFRNVA